MRGRRLPAMLGLALLAAVIWPVVWPRGRDDFPLSSYPMFTARRGKVVTVHQVLVAGAGDSLRPLPPSVVANGAVMQAASLVRRAVARGWAEELCARVAARVAARSDQGDAREVIVATSTFDAAAYFDGARAPLSRHVQARCPVPGVAP